MRNFTLREQRAGYDFSRFDEKGTTDFSSFIKEFEAFPWEEELQTYNQINQGVPASLYVKDSTNNTCLWVSLSGVNDNPFYLIGYIFDKKPKGFLGIFGKGKAQRWMEMYAVYKKADLREYFELYFQGDLKGFHAQIKKLELFGELEPVEY